MKRFLIAVSATAMAFSLSACAQAGPGPDMKEADVERIIKDYLMENPEIIRDALIELDERQDREAIAAVSNQIFNDPRDISVGPDDAKVTVVEFFDYNCGFCKNSTQWVEDLLEDYPDDVRVVFKELPILDSRSKTSRYAAKAALAAGRQDKYTEVHFALMDQRSLTQERIRQVVKDSGADMKKFEADMKDVALDRQIEDTLLLSSRIPALTGTPFFLVNNDFVAGANTNRLDELLAKALES
ncbi:DsbA family protein [Litorimonas haliclonae]|uniref:DsbA family protein n=1 Tax=Litorimonas haliclonae TaxID=2081977 RepID=UPI0039F04F91